MSSIVLSRGGLSVEVYSISSDFIVLFIKSVDARLEGEEGFDNTAAVDVDIVVVHDINEVNLICK